MLDLHQQPQPQQQQWTNHMMTGQTPGGPWMGGYQHQQLALAQLIAQQQQLIAQQQQPSGGSGMPPPMMMVMPPPPPDVPMIPRVCPEESDRQSVTPQGPGQGTWRTTTSGRQTEAEEDLRPPLTPSPSRPAPPGC